MYRFIDYRKIYEQVENTVSDTVLKMTLRPEDVTKALGATDLTQASSFFAKDAGGKEYTIKIFKDSQNIMEKPAEYSQNPSQKFIFPVNDAIAQELLANKGAVTTGLLRSVDDPDKYGVIAPNTPVKLEISLGGTATADKTSETPEQVATASKTEEFPDVPTENIEEVPNESAEPEHSGIMNFDQFVSESKKPWIKDIEMKKGALKKDLGKKKITKEVIKKEEDKLKKKDKDKEKPGLQLDKKDAKKQKRLTLAKNLMKASGAVKESKQENIKGLKDRLVELHKIVDQMIEKTSKPKKIEGDEK